MESPEELSTALHPRDTSEDLEHKKLTTKQSKQNNLADFATRNKAKTWSFLFS